MVAITNLIEELLDPCPGLRLVRLVQQLYGFGDRVGLG